VSGGLLLVVAWLLALPGAPDSTPAIVADSGSVAADTLAASTPAPPRDYMAEMRADFTPESRAYWATRVALAFLEPLAAILVGALVLFSGLAAKLRDVAATLGGSRWVQLLVVLVLFTVVMMALTFPLAWYSDFALEHQYGLSNQSFGAWLVDVVKDAMVGIALLGVVPILALGYGAIRRFPRSWWLIFGLASLPLAVGVVLIQPLVIEPLFNRFTPLQDQGLERRILDLAQRAGIPGRNVYQVDKSRQTNTYNAYVNGFGVSQRIVLWDTTLKGMKDDEILYVVGHEMGHYALGHIWQGIVATALGSFAFFGAVAWIAGAAMRRFGDAWGFHEPHDPASLPLLMTLITLVAFVSQPIVNGYSRRIETQADVFGLEVTRDNDAAARSFLKLGSQNRANPEPPAWVRLVFYSHPTMAERLHLALSYHPWTEGKPNRYFEAGRKP
jgi:Zn-dependent protease with chaperone function